MADNNRCNECFGKLWLVKTPKFGDDGKLTSKWSALDGGWWIYTDTILRSVALTTQVVKPCKCNPDRRSPLAKRDGQSAAGASGGF